MKRLKPLTDKNKCVSIFVDGKRIDALKNEPVGMAIFASGRKVLNRSIRYHRPRSMFCSTGTCNRCLVEIDGIPNRRACSTHAEEGMRIRTQNGFPNAERDLFAILDRFSNHLPNSFYHHHFLHPKHFRQTYLKILKRFTGLGQLNLQKPPSLKESVLASRKFEDRRSEILVLGGGLTGLSAALSAAEAGVRVSVLDDRKPLSDPFANESLLKEKIPDYLGYRSTLKHFENRVHLHPNIDIFQGATITGIHDGNSAGVLFEEGSLGTFTADKFIIATGSYDALPIFRNNDLPGIFSARLIEKMVIDYGLKPGDRALIWGSSALAKQVAKTLILSETKIVGFVTLASVISKDISLVSNSLGTPVWLRSGIFEVKGTKNIKRAIIHNMEDGERKEIACDLVVTCHTQPRYEFQVQAGCEMIFNEQKGGLVASVNENLRSSQPGIYIAGEALGGSKDTDLCMLEGKLAGAASAKDLGYSDVPDLKTLQKEVLTHSHRSETEPMPTGMPDKEAYVCLCEDVKVRELLEALKGLDKEYLRNFHNELLKRRTSALTGPCQGKICLTNFLRLIAAAKGRDVLSEPVPTVRPPIRPLRIGDLAMKEPLHEQKA